MTEYCLMRVFQHNFELIGQETLQELFSLEREGAIYQDLWIEHLQDFRHVKIKLTAEEAEEYVRSLWAYELFLQADSPQYASQVPGIPADIAHRADTYSMETVNGQEYEAPYHCIAGFIGEDLEELVCCPPTDRVVILEELGIASLMTNLKNAVDALTPAMRLFNRREKGLQLWTVSREDDVRDLLYTMLRASISDIRTEEFIPGRAGTHKVVDIYSELAQLLVEVKWISKRGRWKEIVKQINDDIQSYIAHPACKNLVFVIVDAARDIPDPSLLEKDMSGPQIIANRTINVYVFVREP